MPRFGNRGAAGEARTPDPLIANQMLLRFARFDNSLPKSLNLPMPLPCMCDVPGRMAPRQAVQLAARSFMAVAAADIGRQARHPRRVSLALEPRHPVRRMMIPPAVAAMATDAS